MADQERPSGARNAGSRRNASAKIAKAKGRPAGSRKQGATKEFSLFDELQLILAEPRSPDALKRGLIALERRFNTRSAFASVLDPAFDRLSIAQVRGRANPRVKAVATGEGTIGSAFAQRAPVVDVASSMVSVPMLVRGEAIGVITLAGASYGGADGAPTEDELSELAAIANACGAALDMGRARAEVDRRTQELQTLTDRLREGDKTRDALLSHLSHELRTPLSTIKGYLSMALKGRLGEFSPKQENAIGICDRNADRLLRLINDLLLTARLESGKMTLDPKPLGMRSVLHEASQFLLGDAETAGVEIEVSAPEGEVFIRGNRDRLVEGIMHLLERGLRGKRDGERIVLTVEPRGRLCAITAELSGLQVPKAELSRLFESFRADGGPANIGLSIARRIIELHGGHIRGEQQGETLVFQIGLPLFAGAVAEPEDAPTPTQGEILVVEDDDDCREGIIAYLTAEGFNVRAYSDGKEALERIQEVPPALVLLDLRIPGVDGMAVIHAVREGRRRSQATPIYVISGAIDAQSGADVAWGERVDGVFEKPINFPFLLERVRELVLAEGS